MGRRLEPPVPCIHFGLKLGTRWVANDKGIGIYQCAHPDVGETTHENCVKCKVFCSKDGSPQPSESPKFPLPLARVGGFDESKLKIEPEVVTVPAEVEDDLSDDFVPPKKAVLEGGKIPTGEKEQVPETIVDRWGNPAGLLNLYHGCSLFLVLSGPSLLKNDLTKLNQRGIMTMGVNNSPTIFKPNFWTYVDPSRKFHHAIWHDPSILKIVPERKFRERIREKQEDGTFKFLPQKVKHTPAVVGYKRNADFKPNQWLWESTINWGNCLKAAESNRLPRTLNVMFAAIRIAYYLGFRTVYLLGCDFKMEPGKQNYAFPQDRTIEAVGSNNSAYHKLNEMFTMLKPSFETAKFNIYNCYEDSGFTVFPYVPFEDAIRNATQRIPKVLDTVGWYDQEK